MLVQYRFISRVRWFLIDKDNYQNELLNKLDTEEEIDKYFIDIDKKFTEWIEFGDHDKFRVNNIGDIQILYNKDKIVDDIRTHAVSLLNFISICQGFKCQYDHYIKIDDKKINDFFNYPSESKYPNGMSKDMFVKNVKFYELSFKDLYYQWDAILTYLFYNIDYRIKNYLLPYYYASTYYFDYFGNGDENFRRSVSCVESIMSIIKEDDYSECIQKNQEEYADIVDICKKSGYSKRKIANIVITKGISLDRKIYDAIMLGCQILEVNIDNKYNIKDISSKIANTRNIMSHCGKIINNNKYLDNHNIGKITLFLSTLLRMLILYKFNVGNDILRCKFNNNLYMRKFLYLYDFNNK